MSLFSRLPELFDAQVSVAHVAQTGPLTLEVRYAAPDIAERIRPSLPPAERSGEHLRVLYGTAATHDCAGWIPSPAEEPRWDNRDGHFIFWHPGPQGILYAMDYATRTALVWCAADRFPAWECTRPALPLIHAFLVESDWLPLHAAAVSRNGRALLFAGPGKVGKTTTALACARAGWAFAGDDFVLVNTGEPARVAPLYASARLRDDMVNAFAGLASAAIEISRDDNDLRHELRLGDVLPDARFAGGEVAAILLPFRGGALVPTFTPARKSDALGVFMRTTGLFLPGWLDTMMHKFMALIGRAPVFAVDTGMDPSAIPDALDDFLRKL